MNTTPKLLKIPAANISNVGSLVVRTPNARFKTIRTERAYATKKPSRLSRAKFEAMLANQIAASFKKTA